MDAEIPILTPGQLIGTTGRQRWTLSDVHYLAEWSTTPPVPVEEDCDFCFVLLLVRGKMWYHPDFGDLPVSGLYFNRPYGAEEMQEGTMVLGFVVPNLQALPEVVRVMQEDESYVGPVRGFVVGF